jgi:hypothetical protein
LPQAALWLHDLWLRLCEKVCERLFVSHFYIKAIFYQDRLGTNIWKTQKRVPFSLAAAVREDVALL